MFYGPNMQRYKRPPFLFLIFENTEGLDLIALLRGEMKESSTPRLKALSVLTSDELVLSQEDLDLLSRAPTDDWITEQEILAASPDTGPERLEVFVRTGILLSDSENLEAKRLRKRAELIDQLQWHPRAAFHHAARRGLETQGRIEALELHEYEELFTNPEKKASEFIARHGSPPDLFHHRSCLETIDLPLNEPSGNLHEILARRKTDRKFDLDRPLSLEHFSTLLRSTFGYTRWAKLSPELTLVQRTSPSGGSRHPIEAYPLVLNVEGLGSGIYHYDGEGHRLEFLEPMERADAQDLIVQSAQAQTWIATAHVSIFLTARFFKNFWKYRRNYRTYDVILMDAGHLSQTFYLVATDLGLGAFYTGAINAPDIERKLRIESFEEGVLAICGCGIKMEGNDMSLDFKPFIPRQTKL